MWDVPGAAYFRGREGTVRDSTGGSGPTGSMGQFPETEGQRPDCREEVKKEKRA